MKTSILASVFLAVLVACSSDDKSSSTSSSTSSTSSSSGAADACGVTDSAKVTSVNKASGDAACPTLTPAQLNEPDDSGTGGCTPKVDSKACTATITCSETDAEGTKTDTSGSFAKDGTGLKGTVTVVATPSGAAAITCTYTMTIQ